MWSGNRNSRGYRKWLMGSLGGKLQSLLLHGRYVAWQVCCMAGMLDTFSSNVVVYCVKYLIMVASTELGNLFLFWQLQLCIYFLLPFWLYLPCLTFPPSLFNLFIFSLLPLPYQGESVWISRRWTDWRDDGQWCEGNGRTAQAESVLGKRQQLGVLL